MGEITHAKKNTILKNDGKKRQVSVCIKYSLYNLIPKQLLIKCFSFYYKGRKLAARRVDKI